jgi:phosphoribosylformylglycinamidine cyclo-ligase
MLYKDAGVNYNNLDAFKRACQKAASETVNNLNKHGFSEPPLIRGESAYLMETPDAYYAHVEEALGTKILVADAVYRLTGKSYYRNVAVDDVSTIVNDLCSVGALPVSVAMYLGVGDDNYLADPKRGEDLSEGFAEGCRLAGAVWGGGETQTLKGMITPGTAVLGGSAFGIIRPKGRRVTGTLKDGDVIIFLASSGVQTNGLTLCRAIADKLPEGYLTELADGRTYGEALLDPSVIYVGFIAACHEAGLKLNYTSHMTGHGWRKLMRLDSPFVYRIDFIPEYQPVFDLIMKTAEIDIREAYGTFNMGVGFAAYVDQSDADRCLELAKQAGYNAWRGGMVCSENGRKAVDILPLGISYGADSLKIR